MASITEKLDPLPIVNAWLGHFKKAVVEADVDSFVDCIQDDGWFRDLLTFTWGFKPLRGRDAIKAYLSNTLAEAGITNVSLDEAYTPRIGHHGPNKPVIDAALLFETKRALGKGFVRIAFPESGVEDTSKPRAFALMLMINDWKGHEEMSFESGIYDGHNLSWEEVRKQRREAIEQDPSVIIVGAGQTGLQVAARFKQMNIRALVVEKNARVGDNWRQRYPTLALHTPRVHHSFLYQPYPSNWPKFTPKERLANWLEQYAETNDLVVWLRSTVEPQATYNAETGRWQVIVNKNGKWLTLRPAHVVIATSMYGDPNIPIYEGQDTFKGQILHSTAFKGGAPFANKKVVVVGAGNTSADICQDLVFRGASEVTMVQRTQSIVVSDKFVATQLDTVYPEGQNIEYLDLAAFTMPVEATRKLMQDIREWRLGFDREMLDGLAKAGFKLTDGPDNAGQLLLVYERGGGFFVDVGCAPLIINGRIKVKQGCGISQLKPNSVVFSDGHEIDADVIVLATGWHSIRDKLRNVFGDEVVDRAGEIWGIDKEGEIRMGYKPSGQPGFWYALGAFVHTRFYSKQLALFIKAIELGYFSQRSEGLQ